MGAAGTKAKRCDGEAWFAEEKSGLELYHAKVGDHTIVVAIGNVATTPLKNAEKRREHISRVVADNVQRFFLSKHPAETICKAFESISSKMGKRECLDWVESQRGQNSRHVPREVMLEARRRFGAVPEELFFGQFDTAVGRQVRLSQQQWETFRRLADGMLQKQIAGDMKSVSSNNALRSEDRQGLSEETVRKMVKAMREKSDVKGSNEQVVLWFLGFDFIS